MVLLVVLFACFKNDLTEEIKLIHFFFSKLDQSNMKEKESKSKIKAN